MAMTNFGTNDPVGSQSMVQVNLCARDAAMSAQTSTAGLLTLTTVANRLHYLGRDRERSVRRLFAQHGVSMIRRGRRAYFVTECQYTALIEKLTTCLPSGAEARTTTSVVRSVSGGKRASSKSILAEQIAVTMQKPIAQNSRPTSGTKSFTVVEGGRTR